MTLASPGFTTAASEPEFSSGGLAFAAVASLSIYIMFVFTQIVRHRDLFRVAAREGDPHGAPGWERRRACRPPSRRTVLMSLGLLLLAPISVVELAEVESPAIEDAVPSLGLPHAVAGVVVASLARRPESVSAFWAAARSKVQTGLNLAYGSDMGSTGLTSHPSLSPPSD